MKTAKSRGRKRKPFIFQGEHINGLRRRPVDGRWELADGRMFTEPDEGRAVERYRRMTAGGPTISEQARAFFGWDQGDPDQAAIFGPFGILGSADPVGAMWRYFADQVRKYPGRSAERSGIEWIAYGPTLKPPVPLYVKL